MSVVLIFALAATGPTDDGSPPPGAPPTAATDFESEAQPARTPQAEWEPPVVEVADGVSEHRPVDDPETHELFTEDDVDPEEAAKQARMRLTVKEARELDLAERQRLHNERTGLKSEKKRLAGRRLRRRKAVLTRKVKALSAEVDELEAATPRNEAALSAKLEELRQARGQLGQTKHDLKELEAVRADLKNNRADIQATRNFRITPLVGPAYTPELGFSIAGGFQLSWTTDRRDRDLPRSSAPVTVAWSTTGAIVFSTRVTTYWLQDRLRWNTEIWSKDMPDNYWGVGYDAARGPSKPDATTAYDRTWWQVRPVVLGRVYADLFVGGIADFNRTVVDEPSPEIQADPDFFEFGPDNFNGGLGAIMAWDSRDFPVNAYEGIYAAVSLTGYGRYAGGDNAYQLLDLDYRHYLTIVRPGSTLAWQVRHRAGFGDVPYAEKPLLGSPFDLRGYRWGRYRDDAVLYGLLEYRLMFRRLRPQPGKSPLSRHGLVAWVATGTLGDDITEFTNWLPNVGVGYRLEVQPRLNVRMDMGFGDDTRAFYFNFQESF